MDLVYIKKLCSLRKKTTINLYLFYHSHIAPSIPHTHFILVNFVFKVFVQFIKQFKLTFLFFKIKIGLTPFSSTLSRIEWPSVRCQKTKKLTPHRRCQKLDNTAPTVHRCINLCINSCMHASNQLKIIEYFFK